MDLDEELKQTKLNKERFHLSDKVPLQLRCLIVSIETLFYLVVPLGTSFYFLLFPLD